MKPASVVPCGQLDHVELGVDRHGGAEKPEHLVDDVTAEVAQEAAGRAGLERVRARRAPCASGGARAGRGGRRQ